MLKRLHNHEAKKEAAEKSRLKQAVTIIIDNRVGAMRRGKRNVSSARGQSGLE